MNLGKKKKSNLFLLLLLIKKETNKSIGLTNNNDY